MKIYQVDAFASALFSGNPAAVCPLGEWVPDSLMQSIAMENNLSETAFFVPAQDGFHIRWFTPAVEVALCGHATLASAHVLFEHEGYEGDCITFESQSGPLKVTKEGRWLVLDFPADVAVPVPLSEELSCVFDIAPREANRGRSDFMLLFENEQEVRQLRPDFPKIAALKARGVIVTAKGDEADFVSRFFAPQLGINEDPATGSSHTTLTPYWSGVLNKTDLSAVQLSNRGARMQCRMAGDRVKIGGQARTFMTGEIVLP